ncbi:MAG: hypothetical protein ACFB5Z_19345 [Elainellaceae cyanobacterium]
MTNPHTCKALKQTCQSLKEEPEEKTLSSLVDDYIKTFGSSYKEEDIWWGDKSLPWEAAIERAWRSRLKTGKMHGHQRRVAHKLQAGLAVALADGPQVDFDTFEDLHNWVAGVTARVKGLGPTTAYDIARRLGAWLNLEPAAVYLHAGAAAGAEKLGIGGNVVSLQDFPEAIRRLGAMHTENFLCIYKNRIS